MSTSAPPDLTRAEIAEICYPLKQGAAQVRFLQGLGVTVERRPDGSPLVNRQHYITVRAAAGADKDPAPASTGPQWGVHA